MSNHIKCGYLKGVFIFFTLLLTFGFISATPLQDFLSEDVTHLDITIEQTESVAHFKLDTSGYEWDTQEISIPSTGLTLEAPVSSLLDAANFEVFFENGKTYPQFTSLTITPGSVLQVMLDNVFNYYNLGYRCADLNSDLSIINNQIKNNNINTVPFDRDVTVKKQGNDYYITTKYGYDDVPYSSRAEVVNLIQTTFYQVNIKNLMEQYVFPMTSLIPDTEFPAEDYISILEDLDWDYDVSVDAGDFELANGNYPVTVEVSKGSETYSKIIYLTFEGIENQYVPPAELKEDISSIVTGKGVILTVAVLGSQSTPTTIKGLRFLEISTNEQTYGTIYFKVDKSLITNKNNVNLYVLEGTTWTKLATLFLNDNGVEYEYSAFTPHFSTFMIGEDTTVASTSSSSHSSDDDSNQFSGTIFTFVCDAGELRCSGDSLEVCSNNKWTLQEVCPNGCSNNKCTEAISLKNQRGGFLAFLTGLVVGENGEVKGSFFVIVFGVLALSTALITLKIRRGRFKQVKKE